MRSLLNVISNQNYANFTGRATRSEFISIVLACFCWFALFYWASTFTQNWRQMLTVEVFLLPFIIALLLPLISTTVRRLRDIGISIWMPIFVVIFALITQLLNQPIYDLLQYTLSHYSFHITFEDVDIGKNVIIVGGFFLYLSLKKGKSHSTETSN